MNEVEKILGIVGKIIDMASGNVGAIMDAIDLGRKIFDRIENSPGDFDLKDFRDRLNALPNYGEDGGNESK